MLDENVCSRSNMGNHSNAMLREAAKRSNMLVQHDVGLDQTWEAIQMQC